MLEHLRLSTLTWPFPFGVGLGWATAGVPNPPVETARGLVFLLRGQAVVFSGGFGTLCGDFRRAGLWAEDLRCVGDRWAYHFLAGLHRAGKLRGPVVFVGHSCGGRYALVAAHRLARLGIGVDLVVCVDVALAWAVPANVRRAVHLYRGGWRLYPARPLTAAPGTGAAVTNVDLSQPERPFDAAGLHHLNVTGSPAVQAWLRELVLGEVGA